MTETNIGTASTPQVTVIDPRIPEKAKAEGSGLRQSEQ